MDPSAWVDQYGNALYRFALARVRDPLVAEEVVQETLVSGWKARNSFTGASSVSTWLFSILRRKIIDHYRRQQRESARHAASTDELEMAPTASSANWVGNPDTEFQKQEFWTTFNGCVGKLPEKLAEAYTLRELNEKGSKEVCELLGISATNLSMRLYRARMALKDCLQINWFGDAPQA